MKYIVILGDGMADYPVPELGDKTPLQAAHKPHMDRIAQMGVYGTVKTVKDNISPGSDVANLSVLGYDTDLYYTGRSPLEAVSMGVDMANDDTSFRANLVTLTGDGLYETKTMADYSAGEIDTETARALIADLQKEFGDDLLELHGGISYRHLLLWHGCEDEFKLTPPHDISGKQITPYLPSSTRLLKLMEASHKFLNSHPLNKERVRKGLNPANSLWIWGQGKRPQLPSFKEKYGLDGAVISAVDLIKGIGICAKMESIDVEGATGTIDTNFPGKAQAAINALKTNDFVYLHMEAPDECGHHFQVKEKVRSIEMIDELVIGPVMEQLEKDGEEYRIMVLPDHPTPLSIGTHARDAVPFAMYKSGMDNNNPVCYNEKDCLGGLYIEPGDKLMEHFLFKL